MCPLDGWPWVGGSTRCAAGAGNVAVCGEAFCCCHCFRTAHDPSCQQALLRIESLQRRAGAQDRYPCQTLLLGLQAEVVMVQLAVARGEKAFETLRESEQLCSGL